MEYSINERNEFLLRKVHPCLREIMYKLLTSCRISLRPIVVREAITGLPLEDAEYTYAFKIDIPYATRVLSWDVIFNPDDLTLAPDFNFDDERFEDFVHLNNINSSVPEWAGWSLKKSESLELIIAGFVKLFTEYQVTELPRVGAFISEEYHLAVSTDNYNTGDIELIVEEKRATFVINLHLDATELPEYIQAVDEEGILLNPRSDYALLAVYYGDLDGIEKSARLNLSPRLNQFIGDEEALALPRYWNTSLMTYIPKVTGIVQKNINRAILHFQFKKEFIACVLLLRSKSILEYDAFYFNCVSFLCEFKQSYYIVNIELGDGFPHESADVEILPFHSDLVPDVPERINFQYENCSENVPDKVAVSILDQLKTFFVQTF